MSLLALAVAVGCGSDGRADVVDRLWVSDLPQSPRHQFAALFVTGPEAKRLGMVQRGSVYRGAYELFAWKTEHNNRATLEGLQDGRKHRVEVKPCEPAEGFDLCMHLVGDPSGIERWQSKKRWGLGGRNNKRGLDLSQVVAELSVHDPALRGIARGGLSE